MIPLSSVLDTHRMIAIPSYLVICPLYYLRFCFQPVLRSHKFIFVDSSHIVQDICCLFNLIFFFFVNFFVNIVHCYAQNLSIRSNKTCKKQAIKNLYCLLDLAYSNSEYGLTAKNVKQSATEQFKLLKVSFIPHRTLKTICVYIEIHNMRSFLLQRKVSGLFSSGIKLPH